MKRLAGLSLVALACHAAPFYEQSYLRAPHNWAFRTRYPKVDATFNAFDYGHAILYETLIRRPRDIPRSLDSVQFAFITERLLEAPPSVPLDEGAIGPDYVRLAPELHEMFGWAHLLHRQIYDVWADRRLSPTEKDERVATLIRYYRSRPDLALSSRPKSMDLMEGQDFSLAFRRAAPKFNGLIWSYHWMQMAVYEALLAGTTEDERASRVADVVAHFREMYRGQNPPLPTVMPMTPAIAPRFAARYPEASIIFDNLHALHDVASDILASPTIAPADRRRELLRAAASYRDDTTAVTTIAEWTSMAYAMGVGRMGGAAIP